MTTTTATGWLEEAASLPAGSSPPVHVFHTRDWLEAWERTTIETTLDASYLCPGEGSTAVPYYCVESSPFWSGYETEAGVEGVWPAPVAFSPSVYSLYGGGGLTAPEAIRQAVDLGLSRANEWGAAALVFVNVEGDRARRWMKERPPSQAILLDLAFRAPVQSTIEEQLAAIQGRVRRDFRRQWRRACECGVSLLALHGLEMRPWLAEFYRLASETAERHGGNLYDLATFEALSAVPGATLLVAERAGHTLGAFMTFSYRDRLYLWAAGIDYGALKQFGTYAFLMYESMDFAICGGHRFLEVGRGNASFKERHGFCGTELWTLVYLTDRWVGDGALLGRLRAMHQGLREHMGLA